MTLRILLLICATSLVAFPALAQTAATAASAGPTYRLQALYRANVAQSYTITEETTAVRTLADSTKQEYNRIVTYYTTVRCLSSIDGISELDVNIDSLIYRFESDGKVVEYDSQTDITPKNFADLNNYIGPLNRPFEITMSPYGEVTNLEGENIQFWRDYLTENSKDLDSVIYLIWMQSLDRENLLQYGDLQKRVIPGTRMQVDSSWEHNFGVRIDGVVYSDKAKTTFVENSGGVYTLTTQDTIAAPSQKVHVYGIPYVTTVQEGAAAVDHTMTLSSAGTINGVKSAVNAWFRGKAANQVFTHKIASTTTWKLTGQYQW